MTFEELPLAGAYRIGLSPYTDERGFFARTVCEDTLAARGLVGRFRQSSVSFNLWRGTVRGMHYALAPHAETKLVRCTMGAIHDVIVDLRGTRRPTCRPSASSCRPRTGPRSTSRRGSRTGSRRCAKRRRCST